jgi:hypothetical protein
MTAEAQRRINLDQRMVHLKTLPATASDIQQDGGITWNAPRNGGTTQACDGRTCGWPDIYRFQLEKRIHRCFDRIVIRSDHVSPALYQDITDATAMLERRERISEII